MDFSTSNKIKNRLPQNSLLQNIIIALLMVLLVNINAKAQQDPMYTQYMFNQQVINPAYAGTWESLGFMALGRHQWTGWEGAPETYTFTVQAPLKNERVALGLNLISDKVGLEKRFYMYADYSYMVPLNEKVNLRLGLKGGFTSYSNNLDAYNPLDPDDPSFEGNIDSKLKPNFGVGAFLYGKKAYLGFSIPQVVNSTFENDYNNFEVEGQLRHYFLSAGMVFDLGENIKFKPTTLMKASFTSGTGTPVQFDLTGNFLIKEKLWLGAMWRSGDSYGFIAQFLFAEQLRIGYAVDFSTTNLQNYNSGSHEIMVTYEIRFKKEKVVSPRYF